MMRISNKQAGLGMVALAVALMGSAVLADNTAKPAAPATSAPGMSSPMGMMRSMQPMFNFTDADVNKDGKVTPEEFAGYRAAKATAIDADKDGKISVEELATMNLKAMQATAQARAEGMVKAFDSDGDGKLSAAELLVAPMPPDAFAMIDTNKDGVIDQAEADAMPKMMQHGSGHGRGGKWMRHHKMHGSDAGVAQTPDNQADTDAN